MSVGNALSSLGRHAEARRWLTDALARSEHGPVARLAAANDALANLEYDVGDFARAAELYDAGAQGWSAAYGPEHPEAEASRASANEMRAQLARGR